MIPKKWLRENRDDIEDIVGFLLEGTVGVVDEGSQHILTTVGDTYGHMSTAIHRRENYVEHPHVMLELAANICYGIPLSMVLRTFHDEETVTLINGVTVPVKTVRGWFFDGEQVRALSAGETAEAFSFDANTGELLVPEEGVIYGDAWELPDIVSLD